MSLTISPVLHPRHPLAIVWTREDCAKLEADGYLADRYELVRGEIIRKMPQNIPHRIALSRLTGWLYRVFGEDFVQSQSAIDVSPEDNPTSEPEPDVVVLSVPLQSMLQQGQRNPTAAQIRLLVEVSDSTLNYDRTVKAALYARAGILEYWIVDLSARALHILRQPENGQYQAVTVQPETAMVTSLASPHSEIVVASVLP